MAYFIPSSIQKRLLRYALSRLEIVDTDALDLEKLDIAFGKRTTVELQDVGIRINKLASLLHLPPELRILKARILLLRLTVPADIYSSGIVAEIVGVEAHAELKREQASEEQKARATPRVPQSTRRRKRWPVPDDPGVHPIGDDDDELPTTEDLAKSFLEAQPARERSKLEAAVLSQSQQSVASSESSDDSADKDGTGIGISLPGFLASFLEGVANRLEIMVENIRISCDVHLPKEQQKQSAKHDDLTPATIVLHIARAVLGRLIDKKADSRLGQRCISLTGIQGDITSAPAVFERLSRDPTPSSSANIAPSMLPSQTESEATESPSLARDKNKSSMTGSSQESNHLRPARVRSHVQSSCGSISVASSPISVPERAAATTDFAPDADLQACQASIAADASYPGSEPENDELTDCVDDAAYIDHMVEKGLWDSNDMLGLDASTHLPSLKANSRTSSTSSSKGMDYFSPFVYPRSSPEESPAQESDCSEGSAAHMVDLAQSMMFTHEEAESMYMSAFTGKSSPGRPRPRQNSDSGRSRTAGESSIMPPDPQGCEPTLLEACTFGPRKEHFGVSANRSNGLLHLEYDSAQGDRPAVPIEGLRVVGSRTHQPKEASESLAPERVSKRFLDVVTIQIWLPAVRIGVSAIKGSCSPDSSRLYDQASHQTVPGAFSMYASRCGVDQSSRFQRVDTDANITPKRTALQPPQDGECKPGLEYLVGKAHLHLDLSLGRLLFPIAQEFSAALFPKPISCSDSTTTSIRTDSQGSSPHHFVFQSIIVDLLDRVDDCMSSGIVASDIISTPSNKANVLLALRLQHLRLKSGSSSSELAIEKFSLGFKDHDFITFIASVDSTFPNRHSGDLAKHDVFCSIKQSESDTRLGLYTRPIQISLDICSLDEALSSFGGFSGIIDLASSVASNSTAVAKPRYAVRPRGVHFEVLPDPPCHINHLHKSNSKVG